MNELRFDGRTVVVTGAGRGMGRCHALLLASRGAQVVVADVGGATDGTGSSQQPANEVVKEIEAAGGDAVACYASVADPEGAAMIVETAIREFGRLDVVVNNAGISDPGSFEDLTLDQFRRMVEVHYFGTLYMTKFAWPHLRANGTGRVVNIASEALAGIFPRMTSYGAAKGGVFALTRTLAAESHEQGISVNALMPRASTRMVNAQAMSIVLGVPEEHLASLPSFPAELTSPCVAFLAHDACPLNGEILVAGNGQVQRLVLFETRGVTRDPLLPEDILANLDEIMDVTGAQLMEIGGITAPASPVDE